MMYFMYPLAAVVLDFLCVIFCIRLAASKRGPLWLIPMLLSLMLLLGSSVCLIAATSANASETISGAASVLALFLFAVSVIWLLTIMVFSRKTRPDRKEVLAQQTLNEATYIKKRTAPVYSISKDSLPTATHAIDAVDNEKAVKIAEKSGKEDEDFYFYGAVATLQPKRTTFTRGK